MKYKIDCQIGIGLVMQQLLACGPEELIDYYPIWMTGRGATEKNFRKIVDDNWETLIKNIKEPKVILVQYPAKNGGGYCIGAVDYYDEPPKKCNTYVQPIRK